jgi:outer membrane protein, heavy metal efflux system
VSSATSLILGLATLAFLPASASAAALSLSLAEAQARAEKHAPEVRLADRGVVEARATRVGAGIILPSNPRIAFDGRRGLDRESSGELGYAANLELNFETGGAAGARLREADGRERLAKAEVGVIRQEARQRALLAYVTVRLAELRIEQTRAAISLGERLLAAARERSAAGAGSDVDIASAELEVSERQAELRGAEADRQAAEMDLRYLCGLRPGDPLTLTSAIDAPAAVPELQTLLATALAKHPELAALSARLELNAVSSDRLKREAAPKLGAFAGVDSSPASPMFGIAGLSLELPLAQRNQGPRAVLAAERDSALLRLDVERNRLALELGAAKGVYDRRRDELDVLVKKAIPAAESRLGLVETGWRLGRFDVFRVTGAAQDLVRLRTLRLEVLERIWLERARLERLTGGIAP